MDVEAILLKIANQKGVADVTIENHPRVEDGQGYLSKIDIVNVRGKAKNGENEKLSFIIKIAATSTKLRQAAAVKEIFQSEIRMYESIFPAFHKFEEERGVTNPFADVPVCFGAFAEKIPEIIVFENLNEKGFQSWNRKLLMDPIHASAVLKMYGRFHAISFAIQDQAPQYFSELTKNFVNSLSVLFERSGFFYSYVRMAKRVLTLLDPNSDAMIFNRYEKYLNGLDQKFASFVSSSDTHCAILHGDCWSNNFLFKYNNNDVNCRVPSEIRLIDFQLTRMASPVFDIVHFFYVCSSKEVLDDLQTYKRIYYDSFSEHLRNLGSNPSKVYPFNLFEDQWKKYAGFGLVISSLEHHTMLTEENEIINLADIVEKRGRIDEAFNYDIANVDEYRRRMKTIIRHFIDNDFL